MSERTLREVLAATIEELGQPTFALFTTFNFDPIFFEDHVLPVFCEGLDAGTLPGVVAGDQFLRTMQTVVFHDSDQLAQGRKRLSYGTVPLRPASHHFFHPKLILLGNDEEFRLVVTSANLTISGWGRNQEVVAGPVDVPRKSALSLSLHIALGWLASQASEHLTGLDSDRGWYAALQRTIHDFETARRRNDSETLISSWESDRFLDHLAQLASDIHARCLTIYSPYFARDLSSLVATLKQRLGRPDLTVRIVPALSRTREGELQVGICTEEVEKKSGYETCRVVGDVGERFRHAKLYWLEGSRKQHRLVAGSHNFTGRALDTSTSGPRPNVEASLVLHQGETGALEWLGDLAHLEALDLGSVRTMTQEELDQDAPTVSAFACAVVADWAARQYRVTVTGTSEPVALELPGIDDNVMAVAKQTTVAFAQKTDCDLRKRKHFRAWLAQSDAAPVVGLICEVGWELFRQDAMGSDLADYIDVWRARDIDELVDRSQRKKLRIPRGPHGNEDEPDAVAEIAERLERHDHLNTLYGVLGGFVELRRLLDAAESPEQTADLLFASPHSLHNFVRLLEESPDREIPPVRRWVYYTEALHLLSNPSVDRVEPEVRRRLNELTEALHERCRQIEETTELRESDRHHFPDKACLFQWFRDQLGSEFDVCLEGRGQ